MKKAYIFDFDYTLVDATEGIVICFNYALTKMSLNICTTDAIRHTVGYSLADALEMVTGITDTEKKKSFTFYFLEKAQTEMTKNSKLLPYSELLINKLYSEGFRIAIVTSKRSERVYEMLCRFNLEKQIALIIGAGEVNKPKPDTEGVKKALRILNVDKSEAYYVGDSIVDAKTAADAEIDFIGVTTGTTDKKILENYPHIKIISSLEELI